MFIFGIYDYYVVNKIYFFNRVIVFFIWGYMPMKAEISKIFQISLSIQRFVKVKLAETARGFPVIKLIS